MFLEKFSARVQIRTPYSTFLFVYLGQRQRTK